ncbi:hypothetical protein JOF41_005793 [Saccharothrix coeruleofusca]|uniref:hypothetical protein n=1 Tax=Saccharothrix coeruleofusca TaxID=33919 RepID=UPI001AE480DA|nr:hypothetical protein [Saccharothrix coeruleofusca]MBP2339615.1 hypothetical protein [Saccharothrix coeruleofusca]
MLLGVGLAGCGGEQGNPSAASTTAVTGTSTNASIPSVSSTSGGTSLAGFDPCGPFNDVAGRFGLTEIEEADSTSCDAEYSKSVSIRLDVHLDSGIADYNLLPDAEPSDTQVGSRKAKLVKKTLSASSCAVAMEVTTSSRIDVVATANVSLDEACDAVTKVAAAVEPKLPK